MVSAIQSGPSPGAMPLAVAEPAVNSPAKAQEPQIKSFTPTPIAKPEIKVDTEKMRQNLQEAINRLSEMMRDGGRGLNFSMDQKLGRPIVLVRNADTGEVVRQIPNEVVVRVAHSIEDLKGILHNAIA